MKAVSILSAEKSQPTIAPTMTIQVRTKIARNRSVWRRRWAAIA